MSILKVVLVSLVAPLIGFSVAIFASVLMFVFLANTVRHSTSLQAFKFGFQRVHV